MHAVELPGQQALVVRALILAAALVAVVLAGSAGPAAAQQQTAAATAPKAAAGATATDPNALVAPPDLVRPPAGRKLSGARAQAIADRLPLVREERKKFKGSYAGVFQKGSDRWQVSYYSRHKPPREIAQVTLWDVDGRVLEAYVGYKVPWTMARGYPGAFGRKVNSPWVWLPLTALFLLPFLRPPLRPLHLDLVVLAAFGISVALFNDAQIDVSVPFVYPLLAYLLARTLWIGLRSRGDTAPVRLLVPTAWLAIGVIFLIGFRVGLNITNSNVIDVGYAGVIGAQKLVDGDPLYGAWPKDNEHGDTYGPVTYALYVPFEQALPWGGKWDDLPAAHAAAIAFDLLVLGLLFLVGRKVRGPDLGVVLAYCWAAWPFSLYVLNCNANDALVPLFVLLALYVAERPARRGAAVALGGLTKFATLALAPLFLLHGTRSRRALVAFAAAFAAVAAVCFVPVLLQGNGLGEVYERTVQYQAERDAPFSIWGLYDLDVLQSVVTVAAVLLALVIGFLPRRRDLVGLAACAAAVVIALQLTVTYWFYLYLVWFFPLVLIAVLARAPWPARR